MKYCAKAILLISCFLRTEAQNINLDSLNNVLNTAKEDSAKFLACRALLVYHYDRNMDTLFNYSEILLDLALRNGKKLNAAPAYNAMSLVYRRKGNYDRSLEMILKSFEIAEDPSNETKFWSHDHTRPAAFHRQGILTTAHLAYAWLMFSTENFEQQLYHLKVVEDLGSYRNDKGPVYLANMGIANIYRQYKKYDSALIYIRKAVSVYNDNLSPGEKYVGNVYTSCGYIFFDMGQYDSAIHYFHNAIASGQKNNNIQITVTGLGGLTHVFLKLLQKDSSLFYAKKWIKGEQELGSGISGNAYESLSYAYELNNLPDSTHKYLKLSVSQKDSLSMEKFKSLAGFQKLTLSEQLRLQNLEKEKVAYKNNIRMYLMLAGIGVLLLLAIIFYRNNLQKNKAKIRIEEAYDDLKATQQQLIQSEKMASLGELTAGIAHEIQNPLNFVNNFSDVNTELVDEANQEFSKGNIDEVKAILNNIKDNEQKINHHGKRADAIVKGMLQHSKGSTGQKEPTDVNALADEYLRLAYHGLRAKDKSFNATTQTDFDHNIGNVNVVPQEIGRVILNLINNAFYAVNEKQKASLNGYSPTVGVSTAKVNGKIEIRVKDNGNGIPQKVLDKVFQPFFTTKPAGQGTGLGLSLAYDIMKAHGGDITVNTNVGEYTEFILRLPS